MFSRIEEEVLPHIGEMKSDEEIEEAIAQLQKDLKIYNHLQMKLMILKYGSASEVNKNFEDWQDHDSEEFREVFCVVVRDMMHEDPHFIEKLKQQDDELVRVFDQRLKVLHLLEEKLALHFNMVGKGNDDLDSWRADHNTQLMKIIHIHPELLEEFIQSEDAAPNEQDLLLGKIEELLY